MLDQPQRPCLGVWIGLSLEDLLTEPEGEMKTQTQERLPAGRSSKRTRVGNARCHAAMAAHCASWLLAPNQRKAIKNEASQRACSHFSFFVVSRKHRTCRCNLDRNRSDGNRTVLWRKNSLMRDICRISTTYCLHPKLQSIPTILESQKISSLTKFI
jgi:hypothetical protein